MKIFDLNRDPRALGHRRREARESGIALLGVLAMLAAAVVVTAGGTAWWLSSNVYAKPFEPTRLDDQEQAVLSTKLASLEVTARQAAPAADVPSGLPPEPQPYSEDDATREISLTERELNSMVAREPDVARRVAIDLAEDLISVKLLVPVDPDFPVLGGKTLRFNFGLELGFAAGRPVVAIRGVSLGGVPVPSAWWGDIKNQNLVEKFGTDGGFWDRFAKGVENIQVREGHLWVQLKE